MIRTGLTALQHPKLAAGLCATWVVGRVLYTRGYVQDVKKVWGLRGFGFVDLTLDCSVTAEEASWDPWR